MVKEGESKGLDSTHSKWLLEAIGKVKYQKQRPNAERIVHAVKQHHPKISQDVLMQQLELAVKQGIILKVFNKGICSYKDPAFVTQLRTRNLKVSKKVDLTKVIARTLRELGENGGSTLKSVEKYIERSYNVELEDDADLGRQLRVSCKKAIDNGRLIREGRLYKVGVPLSGDTDSGSSQSNGSFAGSNSGDEEEVAPEEHPIIEKVYYNNFIKSIIYRHICLFTNSSKTEKIIGTVPAIISLLFNHQTTNPYNPYAITVPALINMEYPQ